MTRVQDPDLHKGAIEGESPTEPGHGNRNAPGLDENGMPDDPKAIAEDVVGANADETQG